MTNNNKKTKVCILQNGLARGGTDTFVVNLCKSLDKDKYEVTVVNPSSKEESRVREKDVLATGANIVRTCDLGLGLKGKLTHLKRLYSLLKRGKYDVFQTNIDLFNGPNLFVAWLAGVPVRCCHSHNTMQQKALVQGMTLPIHIYQSVMKWMCWTFSNRRCGCSTEAMNFLYKNRDWKKSKYPTIIPNGIDLKEYERPIDVSKKKRELGLTAKHNIITVGRLIPQKNPLFLAEVFCKLCKSRNDCDLVWVGIGPLERECRQIFKDNDILNKVHFLGSRSDVSDILKCCDLFFLPSAFEGLGIVVIEAQVAGLPCVVSDVVPQEANCGMCCYIPLTEKYNLWVKKISNIIDGNILLKMDKRKIQNYSIVHMTQQMEKVFELIN